MWVPLTCSGFAVNAPGFLHNLNENIVVPIGFVRVYNLVRLLLDVD